MTFRLSLLLFIVLSACSDRKTKHLSEAAVLKIAEKNYDLLRTVLKDSLANGIQNVNDYDRSFTGAEKMQLDSLIRAFRNQTGHRITIFTFDSLMTSKDSIEEVTIIVGTKNQVNTTLGISFPNKEIFIWNDSLTNNTRLDQFETKRIIDQKFIPFYKNEAYFKGTFEGIRAIIQSIDNKQQSKKQTKNDG
ncbi:MAG TPA: TPM domain-containing protein [Flavisolibacter sp.]